MFHYVHLLSRHHEPPRGAAGSPASRVLGRAEGSAASMSLLHVRNVDCQSAKSAQPESVSPRGCGLQPKS
jgi:hypothetical protein